MLVSKHVRAASLTPGAEHGLEGCGELRSRTVVRCGFFRLRKVLFREPSPVSSTALPRVMAIPRLKLSQIKSEPTPVIVPILSPTATAEAPPVADLPPPGPVRVPVPGLEETAQPAVALAVPPSQEVAAPVIAVPVATPGAESVPVPVDANLPVAPHVPSVAAPAPIPSAAAAAIAEAVDTPASEALLKHSSSPAVIKSTALVLKWGLITAVLLGIAFLLMRFLVPFLNELRNPKPPSAPIDKDASVAVKVIQQTRQVVATSDAKVSYLNEVIDSVDGKAAEKKVAPPPPPPPRVEPPTITARPSGLPDLTAFRDAVAAMKVDSVVLGSPSRAFIDGRFVKQGDIVHRGLGLRFTGVDPDEHVLLFTNADNVVFKKHY